MMMTTITTMILCDKSVVIQNKTYCNHVYINTISNIILLKSLYYYRNSSSFIDSISISSSAGLSVSKLVVATASGLNKCILKSLKAFSMKLYSWDLDHFRVTVTSVVKANKYFTQSSFGFDVVSLLRKSYEVKLLPNITTSHNLYQFCHSKLQYKRYGQ